MATHIAREVEACIVELLKNQDGLTTYEIAKRLGITWSTANRACQDLAIKGWLRVREEYQGFVRSKKWFLNREKLASTEA